MEFSEGSPAKEKFGVDPVSLKTIRDYASFVVQLSNLEFKGIGSLFSSTDLENDTNQTSKGPTDDEALPCVGPFISWESTATTTPQFPGPFPSMAEFRLSFIQQDLSDILQGERHQEEPIASYLAQLTIRDIVFKSKELNRPADDTYLRHGDSKGNNMLIDEEGHLQAVIDWDW